MDYNSVKARNTWWLLCMVQLEEAQMMSKLKQDEMAGMKGLSQTKPAGIIATS